MAARAGELALELRLRPVVEEDDGDRALIYHKRHGVPLVQLVPRRRHQLHAMPRDRQMPTDEATTVINIERMGNVNVNKPSAGKPDDWLPWHWLHYKEIDMACPSPRTSSTRGEMQQAAPSLLTQRPLATSGPEPADAAAPSQRGRILSSLATIASCVGVRYTSMQTSFSP